MQQLALLNITWGLTLGLLLLVIKLCHLERLHEVRLWLISIASVLQVHG